MSGAGAASASQDMEFAAADGTRSRRTYMLRKNRRTFATRRTGLPQHPQTFTRTSDAGLSGEAVMPLPSTMPATNKRGRGRAKSTCEDCRVKKVRCTHMGPASATVQPTTSAAAAVMAGSAGTGETLTAAALQSAAESLVLKAGAHVCCQRDSNPSTACARSGGSAFVRSHFLLPDPRAEIWRASSRAGAGGRHGSRSRRADGRRGWRACLLPARLEPKHRVRALGRLSFCPVPFLAP